MDADARRETIRNIARTDVNNSVEDYRTNPIQNDPYNIEMMVYSDESWDYASVTPHWKQAKIDAYLNFDEIYQNYEEKGQVKVLRGNPKKMWQILDDTFPVGKYNPYFNLRGES